MAKRLYSKMFSETSTGKSSKFNRDMVSHDLIMKQVQLDNMKMDCTALIVDESQDTNPCQIDWIVQQREKYNTHVIFVGDQAQSVYSFRGAKSHEITLLANARDFELDQSYRFGNEIAAAANCILLAKKLSPQTSGDPKKPLVPRQDIVPTKSWNPYLISGCAKEGCVTNQSLIDDFLKDTERHPPITILAYANIDLFNICLEKFLNKSDGSDRKFKIAYNGRGRGSGAAYWKAVVDELTKFFEVYLNCALEKTPIKSKLDLYPWNDRKEDELVDWDTLCQSVKGDEELMKYQMIVEIIVKNGVHTLDKFYEFLDLVSNDNPNKLPVKVILSTVHSAKGMEWDYVQLCDGSLKDLSMFRIDGSWHSNDCKVEFNWKHYGDEYNIWYVALTRAKKKLSIPEKLMKMIRDLRYLVSYGKLHLNSSSISHFHDNDNDNNNSNSNSSSSGSSSSSSISYGHTAVSEMNLGETISEADGIDTLNEIAVSGSEPKRRKLANDINEVLDAPIAMAMGSLENVGSSKDGCDGLSHKVDKRNIKLHLDGNEVCPTHDHLMIMYKKLGKEWLEVTRDYLDKVDVGGGANNDRENLKYPSVAAFDKENIHLAHSDQSDSIMDAFGSGNFKR